jgi:hypothetical protein
MINITSNTNAKSNVNSQEIADRILRFISPNR